VPQANFQAASPSATSTAIPKQDVAAANYGPTGGNSVSVILGTGMGSFSSPTITLPLPAGTNPFGITTGKFIDGSSNLSSSPVTSAARA